jgi:hypothetical protein
MKTIKKRGKNEWKWLKNDSNQQKRCVKTKWLIERIMRKYCQTKESKTTRVRIKINNVKVWGW